MFSVKSALPRLPLPSLARQLADDRRGVAAIVTAVALVVLMGFCGLAVDVGMWEVNQRAIQGAADQSALAGAAAYRNAGETAALGSSTTAQNAAYATALRSGYPASAITVAAYNNGSTCTNNGCLKVSISQQQPRYFTALFLSTGPTAAGSAVSTCSGCGNGAFTTGSNGGNPCVMALDSSGKGVITASGTPTMSLNMCNLYNNSPQTNATILNGGAIVQGCSATNSCGSQAFLAQPNTPSGNIDVPVVNNASPAPDPYAGLTPPTPVSPCTATLPANPVPSGTYCGGNKFQNKTITFATGAVIIITGGMDLHSGSTSLTGTGVMIYVVSDGSNSEASTINATTTINISAPTTGQYAGVTLWFDGASPVSYSGSNGSSFKGAIYAPSADVTYTGNAASASTCTRLVAASVSLAGTATAMFDNSGCPALAGPSLASSGGGSTPYTGSPILVQ